MGGKAELQTTLDVFVKEEESISKPINGWERIKSRWIRIRGREHHEFEITHRLYSGTELSWLLSEAGFHSIQLYGSLEGTSYDITAQRLIAVAIK